ncbi:transposase [Bradyrhizobium sp. WD16]|uniref:transposase n=1 Tax=Bradyrhizobium sp. WD16 TaxID=1521768 RepID=UPI002206A0B0|nr:hypothetical protein DB459_26980 [Bradyrhizobium sp. WD16]
MATDFSPEILDQILAGGSLKPEDLAGEDGLFRRLKKALLERALGAELTHHLGYEKGDPAGRGTGNSRNGTSSKALLTDDGEIEIEVPRARTARRHVQHHQVHRPSAEPPFCPGGFPTRQRHLPAAAPTHAGPLDRDRSPMKVQPACRSSPPMAVLVL